MAKIPAAIGDGQFTWVGAYDQCMENQVVYNSTINGTTELREYYGKYCRLDLVPEAAVGFVFK